MLSLRPLVLATLSLLLAPLTFGQITNVDDTTATPVAGVGHDYIRMLSESVNPATGTVSLRIQLPTPKGRGITLPFSIDYDSGSVNHLAAGAYPFPAGAWWSPNVGTLMQGGWSYGIPSASFTVTTPTEGNYPNYYACTVDSNYEFRDPAGGLHSLPLQDAQGPNGQLADCAEQPVTYGGDAQFQASIPWAGPQSGSPPTPAPFTVTSPDGTAYYFSSINGSYIQSGPDENAYPPDYIQDRNGNRITSSWSGSGANIRFTFTDMLGRSIISSNGFGGGNTLTVGGLTYQVIWKTTSANYTAPSNYVGNVDGPGGANDWDCDGGMPANTNSQQVISQITLPNSTSFTFYYGTDVTPHRAPTNPFGLLSEIDYPSGAWVQYTWALNSTMNELADWPGEYQVSNGPNGGTYEVAVADGCKYQYETPVVTARTVSFGGSAVLTQNFSYSTNWAAPDSGDVGSSKWNSKVSTVTTVDAGQSSTVIYTYGGYGMLSSSPSTETVEHSVQYYNSSGNLLRTVTKGWINPYDIFCQVTTLNDGNGESSGTWFVYGTGYQITDKREYDYGLITASSCVGVAGDISDEQAALPSAVPTRETVTTYQTFPATSAGGTIYDRPSSVQVWANGTSGTLMAETDYTYDGGSPTVGNPTRIAKRCLQTGSACAAGDLVTLYSYDSNGQITSKTDGRGNTTQYSYTDDYNALSNSYATCNGAAPPSSPTDAYLTQITYPPTNGVQHIVKFCYGYDDGQLRGSSDQNGQTTIYKYNDPLDRPTETDFPDGGQTAISYNDTALSVTTERLISSGIYLTSTDTFDGAGHQTESLLTTDPDCATGDRTDTTYDGLGRVHTISNPYCSTTDPTYGVTTYTYDALGRTIQVTNPDNSTVITSYAGAATEVKDESGKQRISQVDGLGRLTSVCEVTNTTLSVGISGSTTPASCGLEIPGTGFLTTYAYDGLDDLIGVTQSPLNPRSFTYNSLGELVTANNPESGQTSYTYDADGNLATKTDARSITITYAYDALNRLTGKTYSDSTPAVTYNYDQTSAYNTTLTNTIGRLSSESTAGPWSTWEIHSYDPLGRIVNDTQQNIQWAQVSTYVYDLLGDVTTAYQQGAGTFSNTYNSAARLTGATSTDTEYGATPTLISVAHYNALGEITADTLGNGITETWGYDDRGRKASYTVTSGSSTPYSYSLSYFPNGNVMSSNDSINGDSVYGYDDFNRLITWSFTGARSRYPASFAYVYDRYGNRWEQSVTSGSGDTSNLAFDTNNRITGSGIAYDAAGNVTYDGTNTYTYDAEERTATVPNLGTTYIYDAEGRRVAVVNSSEASCYMYNLEDHVTLEYICWNGAGRQRMEYWTGGRHVATYTSWPFFNHQDWLGTDRYRSNSTGGQEQYCLNNPFGDNQWCAMAHGELSPVHFTGKERDTGYTMSPTNLDNFGARYYSSAMGRFMTPDWAAKPTAVPYANFGDPQSLNLYSYVRNNPVTSTDPDGHQDPIQGNATTSTGGCGVPTQPCPTEAAARGSDSVRNASTSTELQTPGHQSANKNSHYHCVGCMAKGGVGGYAPLPSLSNAHPPSKKDLIHALIILTVVTGLLDDGISDAALPLEEDLLAGGEAEAGEAAEDVATTPAGRPYSAHYLNETGPVRNIPGSVVDETIDHASSVEELGDRTVYYSSENNVTVVQSNTTGKIMSVRKGTP